MYDKIDIKVLQVIEVPHAILCLWYTTRYFTQATATTCDAHYNEKRSTESNTRYHILKGKN